MKELLLIVDAIIIFLLTVFLVVIFFVILPSMYGVYLRHQFNSEEDYSRLSYLFNGKFWKWVVSKEGLVELFKDSKQRQIVYYNNFRLFNLIWKVLLVILTFRVLVMLFGPNQIFERGMRGF